MTGQAPMPGRPGDLLEGLRKQHAESPWFIAPVLQELAGDQRRVTKIQLRGNWQTLGDAVVAGMPASS